MSSHHVIKTSAFWLVYSCVAHTCILCAYSHTFWLVIIADNACEFKKSYHHRLPSTGGASSTEYGIAMGAAVVAVLLVLFGVGLCLCVILQYLKQQREGPEGHYRPALSRDVYSVEAVNIGEKWRLFGMSNIYYQEDWMRDLPLISLYFRSS